MSCSPFDLRDYFLQELASPQQRQVEAHVKTCAPCREELDRLRITRHREDALDLTQDVFLKAYQNLRKLDDPARFAPWLYRIAHNEAYSMFRKRKPETDVDEIEPESVGTGITVGGSSVFPVELSLAVASALGRLSADQREAVVLKIYQGFKFEEMAEILACPVSTVKSRLYTALELLKVELAPVKTRDVS